MGVPSEVRLLNTTLIQYSMLVSKFCSLPAGLVTLVILYIFIPSSFPHSLSKKSSSRIGSKSVPKEIVGRIDFLGATLLFGASVCFVAALEEAGTRYEWSSPTIVVLLVLSGVLASSFLWREHSLDRGGKIQEAVLTWRLLKHRVFMGSLALVKV